MADAPKPGRQVFWDPRKERYETCKVELLPGERDWVLSQAWPGQNLFRPPETRELSGKNNNELLWLHAVTGHFTTTDRLQVALLVQACPSSSDCIDQQSHIKLLVIDEGKVIASVAQRSGQPFWTYAIEPTIDTDQDGLSELLLVRVEYSMGNYVQTAEHIGVQNGQLVSLRRLRGYVLPDCVIRGKDDLHSATVSYFTPGRSNTPELCFDYEDMKGHCFAKDSDPNDDAPEGCEPKDVPWKVIKRRRGLVAITKTP